MTNRDKRGSIYFLFDFYIGHFDIESIGDAKGNDMADIADMARDRCITPQLLHAVFATSLLNGLALFDLAVFAFFGAMIGDQLFPFTEPMTSLLLAAATFGVGLFARPLGGLLLGAYADRRGRLPALVLSCWLATLGTAMIVLCPTYERIGLAAPLIFVVARLLQGFAVGGEVGVAAAWGIEVAPPSRRGFLLGCQLAGHGLAPILGASLGILLSSALLPAQLFDWGWRLAFAMGLPLIGVAYYLRWKLRARAPFNSIAAQDDQREPVAQTFRHHRAFLLCATMLMGFRTVPHYAIVSLIPQYVGGRSVTGSMGIGLLVPAFAAVLVIVLSPVAGIVIDKLPRRKPLLLVCIGGTAIAGYLLFATVTRSGSAALPLVAIASITALIAFGECAATVLLLEAAPRTERATAYGTSYAIGAGIFGSTAPLAATVLMKSTANPSSVGWYVLVCSLLSAVAAVAVKERRLGR